MDSEFEAQNLGHAVLIPVDEVKLHGDLEIPENAGGLVLFAHGSGSSQWSPRNRFVAEVLRRAGIGTLLFDFLTPEEAVCERIAGHLRSDVALLGRRLIAATRWATQQPATQRLGIGYFGASTGAAAAMVAAAEPGSNVKAIVSRGGRPDLAGASLLKVAVPTLLIVGEHDEAVIALNELACQSLPGEKKLVLVPWATHLFEEPDALSQVAELAAQWFRRHLAPTSSSADFPPLEFL